MIKLSIKISIKYFPLISAKHLGVLCRIFLRRVPSPPASIITSRSSLILLFIISHPHLEKRKHPHPYFCFFKITLGGLIKRFPSFELSGINENSINFRFEKYSIICL